MIEGHSRPVTAHDKVGGCRGGRGKEPVTWHQPPRDTKTTQYWVLATSDRCHSTSRKWYQQSTVNHSNVFANYPVLKLTERGSWFVANGLHVPPIAYKLHSLSHLSGLILQVAGTPTQGVLVSDRTVRSRIVRSLVQSKANTTGENTCIAAAKQRPLTQPMQSMQGRADNNKHFASCSFKQHLLLTWSAYVKRSVKNTRACFNKHCLQSTNNRPHTAGLSDADEK